MRPERKLGAVLVVTLLVMLAMELLAHGVLLLAREQLAASQADLRVMRARAGARAAVTALPAGLSVGLGGTAVGGTAEGIGPSLDGLATRWRVRRLTRESWLVEGWGRVADAAWEAREARLIWRIDPAARTGAFSGVAEVGHPRLLDQVGAVLGAAPGEVCADAAPVLDTLFPRGLPALTTASAARIERGPLGGVEWDGGLEAIPVHVTGRGTPAPADSAGVCVDGAWNWGNPSDRATPCGEHHPWRAAPGDLVVEGGAGQAVLLVLGDVEMVGTLFKGVLLVRGDVRLKGGTEIHGFVLAGGTLMIDASSRVTGSACEALAAFTRPPASLTGLRPLEGVGWLPVP